jgi:hypothetical protein
LPWWWEWEECEDIRENQTWPTTPTVANSWPTICNPETLYFRQPLTLTDQEINPNGSYPKRGERKDNEKQPTAQEYKQWEKGNKLMRNGKKRGMQRDNNIGGVAIMWQKKKRGAAHLAVSIRFYEQGKKNKQSRQNTMRRQTIKNEN